MNPYEAISASDAALIGHLIEVGEKLRNKKRKNRYVMVVSAEDSNQLSWARPNEVGYSNGADRRLANRLRNLAWRGLIHGVVHGYCSYYRAKSEVVPSAAEIEAARVVIRRRRKPRRTFRGM